MAKKDVTDPMAGLINAQFWESAANRETTAPLILDAVEEAGGMEHLMHKNDPHAALLSVLLAHERLIDARYKGITDHSQAFIHVEPKSRFQDPLSDYPSEPHSDPEAPILAGPAPRPLVTEQDFEEVARDEAQEAALKEAQDQGGD